MKELFKTLLIIVLLFPKNSNAQLCIVYDKDGYTNVRKKPSGDSEIIGKIIEGQVFTIASYIQEENKSKDWIAVNFSLSKDLKEKNFLKFDSDESLGYIHKSRLIELETLPVFEITEVGDNKVIHSFKDVQITVETQYFKKSDHKVIQSKEGYYLVDGEKAYPYYGGNSTEIKSIILKSKNKIVVVPKNTFKNLFEISALSSKVYIGNNGELYIEFDAGDGADSYNIIYCLKNANLFSMTITSTLP